MTNARNHTDEDIRDGACAELWADICRTKLALDRTGDPETHRVLLALIARHNAILTGEERPVH